MRRKLVILEVLFSESWGGLEMLACQYALWFSGRGHTVIFSAPENKPLKGYLGAANVRLVTTKPLFRYLDFITARKLRNIIRSEKVDVIHAHISRDLSTVRLASGKSGLPALVFSQHMDSRYPKQDIFHRWVYRGVDRIVSITDGMRENQLRYTHARPEQVVRIYNGIDTARFVPAAWDRQEICARYRIPPDKRVVGVIGRLDRLKNQMLLVRAAPLIIAIHKDVHFLIVGDETPGKDGRGYREEIELEISSVGVKEFFSILPFQENIEELMAVPEVVVLTTPKESFGLVLVEAMAMGIPVIGANAGGAAEIICDYKTGRLFTPDNEKSLADAISFILDDAELARSMGEAGRKDALLRFDRENNFLKYENMFYEILGM